VTRDNGIADLQAWYHSQCDGDWEHDWRVRIGTLDNPGWDVSINLDDMELPAPFDRIVVERTEENWYRCRLEGVVFNGVGGPENLAEIIAFFLKWINGSTPTGR
jgi:hypothetical protein